MYSNKLAFIHLAVTQTYPRGELRRKSLGQEIKVYGFIAIYSRDVGGQSQTKRGTIGIKIQTDPNIHNMVSYILRTYKYLSSKQKCLSIFSQAI